MERGWRIGARVGALAAAAILGIFAAGAYVYEGARAHVALDASGVLRGLRGSERPVVDVADDGGFQVGTAVGTDEQANVYLAGLETGVADAVQGALPGFGAIVSKLDGLGARLWSRVCPGSGALGEPRIAVGVDGDVAMVITFQGSIDCGTGAVMAAGGADDFDGLVVKLDAAGDVVWTRSLGDVGVQTAAAVAIDPWGCVVVAGSFEGTLALGGAQLTAESERDVLLVKLDVDGQVVWGERFGRTGRSFGVDVDVASSGRIVLLARGGAEMDLGGGVLSGGGEGRADGGGTSSYVATFDPRGRHLWSRRLGGSGDVLGAGARAIQGNRVVVAGSFTGTADLGTGPQTSAGSSDVFVAKLSSNGDGLWSEQFGDGGEQGVIGIATGPGGRIAITGRFNGTLDFGDGSLASVGTSLFVAKLDTTGQALWSVRGGEASSPSGLGITIDGGGHVLVTGALLRTTSPGEWSLVGERAMDLLAARLEP